MFAFVKAKGDLLLSRDSSFFEYGIQSIPSNRHL